MTLNDLRGEIAALGFDNTVEIDTALTSTVNRALVTIFTERPVAKTIKVNLSSQNPLFYEEKITHTGGSDLTIELQGSAYVFRVSGKGHFTVKDGISTVSREFDTQDSLFRGKIRNSDATITFSGDFLYTVFALTCYADLLSDSEDDIPEYSRYTEYDINKAYGDFLAFLGPPTERGVIIGDALLQNGIIRLPRGKYSEITLTYARMPKRVTLDSADTPIDISGECSALLPLLCASYMWLDDDAERAQYYMSLYRSGMSFIRRYNTSMSECRYNDVLGWA